MNKTIRERTSAAISLAKRHPLMTAGASLAIVAALSFGFSAATAKGVDLVEGINPMSTSMSTIAPTIDVLETKAPNERQAFLDATWPHLATDVTYFLRSNGQIPANARVARVQFRYGDLDRIHAQEAGGNQRFGYVSNQLAAVIYLIGEDKPRLFLVQCTNGMAVSLDRVNAGMQDLGTHQPIEQFTIGAHKGLLHYTDWPTTFDLGRRFHLSFYRTKAQTPENLISLDEAMRLQSQTDRVQVTVRVFDGDRFDLRAGTYTPVRTGMAIHG